jgi:hypothetical protein
MSQQPPPLSYAPPARSNGLGIAGFVVSLVGLISCGALSPVGLLLSFIAVFKRPRGFALAGLILGVIGCIWAIIALVFGLFALVLGGLGIAKVAPMVQTEIRMVQVAEVVAAHKGADGSVPTDLSTLTELSSEDRKDAWGHLLRVVPKAAGEFDIVSDGPDGIAGTSDDLKSSTISESDRPRLRKHKRPVQVD